MRNSLDVSALDILLESVGMLAHFLEILFKMIVGL